MSFRGQNCISNLKTPDERFAIHHYIEKHRKKKTITISQLCYDADIFRSTYYHSMKYHSQLNFLTVYKLINALDCDWKHFIEFIKKNEKKYGKMQDRNKGLNNFN